MHQVRSISNIHALHGQLTGTIYFNWKKKKNRTQKYTALWDRTQLKLKEENFGNWKVGIDLRSSSSVPEVKFDRADAMQYMHVLRVYRDHK